MNAERVFAAVLLTAAVFLLYLAWGYTAPIAYDPLGPRPYPVLVLSLMAACCLYLLLFPPKVPLQAAVFAGWRKTAVCVAMLLAYAVAFEPLGFPLATALAVFALGRLFGGGNRACVVAAAALGIGLYVLFDRLLDVSLPLGWIAG